MSEVKVKKIKKVVKTDNSIPNMEDTRYQTFGIDTEPKKDLLQFPKTVKKVKKIVKLDCLDTPKTDEQTYYVHTCGYDYVVDGHDCDFVFSGSKDECDNWMKEHSIVQGLIDDSDSDFDSSNKMSDDELFALLETSEVENKITDNIVT